MPFVISKHLGKGLEATKQTTRNQPFLIEALGCFPYEESLETVEQLILEDISALPPQQFPFPQLFILSECILVLTPSQIWEYENGILTLMMDNIENSNFLWAVVDFRTFLYLTNGTVAITKNAETSNYELRDDLPIGRSLCNYNGQVLVGSPRWLEKANQPPPEPPPIIIVSNESPVIGDIILSDLNL